MIKIKRTPRKFPNKSGYSKLLSGIKVWLSSKNIEIKKRYKNNMLILSTKETTPNEDKIKNA